jgi:hypothetical protein
MTWSRFDAREGEEEGGTLNVLTLKAKREEPTDARGSLSVKR